jgi:hypothetical protein
MKEIFYLIMMAEYVQTNIFGAIKISLQMR